MDTENKTLKELEEANDKLYLKASVYEYILRKYKLLDEAEAEIKAAKKRSEDFHRAVNPEGVMTF